MLNSHVLLFKSQLAFFQGDVYIHVLATGRNPVEDPPSISEGCGGRITDYRIEVGFVLFCRASYAYLMSLYLADFIE